MAIVDPVTLAQTLIRCRSVTPEDGGAVAAVAAALEPLGFVCHRLRFETPGTAPIENLYARIGSEPPKAADIKEGDASVSTQTGALQYSFPLVVPPGRQGAAPHLALS